MKKQVRDFEELLEKKDDKINVLVMGTSGCGKSTLINAVLEDNQALVGVGKPITKEINVYENNVLPFRMIDTVGFEYGLFKQLKIKHDLDKWGKDAIKDKKKENVIHAIWFCTDGTVKRIHKEVLDYLHDISRMWKNVPIIVVFTKSYSKTEIEENIQMFNSTLSEYKKKNDLNIKGVIPVVAKSFPLDDETFVPSFGLDNLVNKTAEIIPEAKQIANSAIRKIDIQMKKNMANSVLSLSTISAVVVGAVPLPTPDAAVLIPLQDRMLKQIIKIYNVQNKSAEQKIVDSIMKVGGTTLAGKMLLNMLKANPALNIGADILNAAVAGLITFVAGEAEIIILEKAYKGEIDLNKIDIDENVIKIFKDKMPLMLEMLSQETEQENKKLSLEKLGEIITNLTKKK